MNKKTFFSILLLTASFAQANNETIVSSEDIENSVHSVAHSISNAFHNVADWVSAAPGKIKTYFEDETIDFVNLPGDYHAIIFKNHPDLVKAAEAAGYSVKSVTIAGVEYAVVITDSDKESNLLEWLNN